MSTVRIAFTTLPPDQGTALVRTLVDEGWIACANVIPGATSIYRWEGEVQEDRETVVVMKTRADLVEGLGRRLAELHPYDVPELVALPVEQGLSSYLDWVGDVTRDSAE